VAPRLRNSGGLEAEEEKLRTETAAEQTTQEGEGKHGSALELKSCYAKRGIPGDTPAGCISVDVVSPAEGFEDPFGGTLVSRWINGVSTTDPSRWFQFGERGEGGEVQCETEGCTAFGTPAGRMNVTGYQLQLLQLH
jgi:hypothetical protein